MDQDAVKAKAQMTDLVVAGWWWVGPDRALLHLRHEDGSEVDPVGLGLSLGARVRVEVQRRKARKDGDHG